MLAVLLSLLYFEANAQQERWAEKVYLNARIHTVDEDNPIAGFLAIHSGWITGLGTPEQAKPFIGPGTEVIDLNGDTVLPGLHDAHVHLLASQLKYGEFNCSPGAGTGTVETIVEALEACTSSRRSRPGNWLIIGPVANDLLGEKALRNAINTRFPDTPVLVSDYSNHNALANRRALELADVTSSTKSPKGGTIIRDGNGIPTGLLIETAVRLVYRVIPDYDEMAYLEAIRTAVRIANRYGITSVQEASAIPGLLRALKRLDERGELTLHVAAHIVIDNEKFSPNALSREAFNNRERYTSTHIAVNHAKIWLDGQPLDPFPTHAQIDPLTGEVDDTFLLFDQKWLNQKVLELDRLGIKVKLHAVGTGAARSALDAVAFTRQHHQSGINHDIAHAIFIEPVDIPRFALLNVTAEQSPAIWHLNLPELAEAYPFRALVDGGANVTIGSDWLLPRTPNLFPSLQGVIEDRGIDRQNLLNMLTINGAKAVGMEEKIGSLEVGKSADFIVLDRDPMHVPSADLKDTKVLMTVFEGNIVYSNAMAGLEKKFEGIHAYQHARGHVTFYKGRVMWMIEDTVTGEDRAEDPQQEVKGLTVAWGTYRLMDKNHLIIHVDHSNRVELIGQEIQFEYEWRSDDISHYWVLDEQGRRTRHGISKRLAPP